MNTITRGKEKIYLTFDQANGTATMWNRTESGNINFPYYVKRHIRRNSNGEITGEYFTIHKKRIAKNK